MSRHYETYGSDSFHGIHTVSDEMRSLFGLIERVARTESSVLIRGETGTGKELVARAIHRLGPRREKSFRAVNCATFTPEMLASELFGHVRGAFTGAVNDRPGLFVQAHSGTLFLDEVAEIPLDIQARLLRVLQDQQFTPVGGTDIRQVNVRIIAATHQALRREVARSRFRADLMYRIRVVPIYLPPLRERTGDIHLLAQLFIEQFNQNRQRQITSISPEARDLMLQHPWPGNVRELRNVIEHAFVMGEGPVMAAGDLTPELRGEAPAVDPMAETIANTERQRILSVLNQCGGKRVEAALKLGMSRSTLWRKIREYGL